jgi:hypothetical protein
MGLDITAYSKVELLETLPDYDAYYEKYEDDSDTTQYVYADQDFPARLTPIVGGGVYKIHGERSGFHAGSYSGYGEWRNDLALMALGLEARAVWNNRAGFAGCAFYELIDFSDCEGIIGTTAAQKLAADFDRFQDKADQDDSSYFREKYALWRKACHLAADSGFIYFH